MLDHIKITNEQHKQRSGQHTLARQKNIQKTQFGLANRANLLIEPIDASASACITS
jgi:hypothetical protein